MKEIIIEKCPFCAGTELIECRLSSYGGVYVGRGIRGAAIFSLVCRDCGSVVRNYCKDPEKLYPRKERRS